MKKWKWPIVWLVQILAMSLAALLTAFTQLTGAVIYGIMAWIAMPTAGAASAYRATRRGLNNYAAWIAPPICMAAVHWLLWTYPPGFGPVLLCAFVSLVGAAAGEVMNQRKNKR